MFELVKNGDLEYYKITEFEQSGLVKHCFTTKRGGVSRGIYESMNLRVNSEDLRKNIFRNFEIICREIGTEPERLVLSNQVHQDKIVRVGAEDCGNGLYRANKFESADALITDEPGVCLVTFFADCVPVFLLDTERKVISLVHSGWRGTAAGIVRKAIAVMRRDYKSKPENILAAIGPSVGVCCFEVGDEVKDVFEKEFGKETVEYFGEKPHVNMQAAVKKQLFSEGVFNVIDSGICTYCNSKLLFSHRKTKGKRGNLAAFMELR